MPNLAWHEVEKAIAIEVEWLKRSTDAFLRMAKFQHLAEFCNECIFRRIGILIVTGNVHAKNITSNTRLFGAPDTPATLDIGKPHGKEWHHAMMQQIAAYFIAADYKVAIEPNLNFGRADLGIYKDRENPLFVEVGTIALSKLLMNLESMRGSDFLLVVAENHAIEFSVRTAGYENFSIFTTHQ